MYNKTRLFLKSNPSLYILQADKGSCTVAIDKDEYIQKTSILLQDVSTYVRLEKDPTISIQKSLNDVLKYLKTINEKQMIKF